MTRRWWWSGLSRALAGGATAALAGCSPSFRGGTMVAGSATDSFEYKAQLRAFDASVPNKHWLALTGLPSGPFSVVLTGDCRQIASLQHSGQSIQLRFSGKTWTGPSVAGGAVNSGQWTMLKEADSCVLIPTRWDGSPLQKGDDVQFFLDIHVTGNTTSGPVMLTPTLVWERPPQ